MELDDDTGIDDDAEFCFGKVWDGDDEAAPIDVVLDDKDDGIPEANDAGIWGVVPGNRGCCCCSHVCAI